MSNIFSSCVFKYPKKLDILRNFNCFFYLKKKRKNYFPHFTTKKIKRQIFYLKKIPKRERIFV